MTTNSQNNNNTQKFYQLSRGLFWAFGVPEMAILKKGHFIKAKFDFQTLWLHSKPFFCYKILFSRLGLVKGPIFADPDVFGVVMRPIFVKWHLKINCVNVLGG